MGTRWADLLAHEVAGSLLTWQVQFPYSAKRNVITNQELIGYVVLWADSLHVAAADCSRMPEEAQIQ
jgi:hypothetical protein